ncbi:recombinase family protein [Pseudoduganella umbonata]|uniref:DNA invertase Pin-like site-specific DNA recombinase n=1 Tax=Pseudoduganella umbonata TaxID=864828 RepID=A0A4P8HLA9_9BURK|nr:recombinase family protein [Pseudoduganella umbonata]MBB3221696.1 DNA invertase Pin-like site-specific DNA recombinase [Pseudoduganella umbonata]QCP09082.1 recombinase family protein [Pseudoduganella umbonata]
MHVVDQESAPRTLPVAAYARMSTDSQNHSIQHQLDSIALYAQGRAMRVTRTFVDEGRSGLSLHDRPGLQALLAAVTERPCGFAAVIVYDVSRWGRFQDVDESAFYEYLCRRAGVPVVYCAELFADDGSPMQALLKGIKRIMAAEYSRELSTKVWHAQCRFIRLGYKQGGLPGFGLSRVSVSADGLKRGRLAPGERKFLATDRVALEPGCDADVALVCRIYMLYTMHGFSDSAIARQLDAEGLRTHLGKPWDPATVRRILTSEKYCGVLVFNQTTRKLRSPVAGNPQDTWVRCDTALAPIVSRETFQHAQDIRAGRATGPDRQRILALLRDIHARHGTINARLCHHPELPGRNIMRALFGGYVGAYAEAGLPVQRTVSGALAIRSTRVMMKRLIEQCAATARRGGATVAASGAWNVLLFNDTLHVRIALASSRRYPDTVCRWRVPVRKGASADFVLCALLDRRNDEIERYILVETHLCDQGSLFLSERKLAGYSQQCFATLEEVFGLAR